MTRDVARRELVGGAAVLLVGVVAFARPASAQVTLQREITDQVTRYVASVNRGDPREVADLYARTPGVSSLGDGEITIGWSDILALYRSFMQQFGRVTMTVDSLAVVPVGSDGAVAAFRYRWHGVKGRDSTSTDGAMTLVYQRTAQGWRIVHDHTSTRPNKPGPARTSTDEQGDSTRPGSSALLRAGPVGPTDPCMVQRVIDGDTFDCAGGLRVRMIGVDAPERSQRPFGAQATAALRRLLPVGSPVLLERDVEPTDRYGRRLAYVWSGGIFINWQMVRGGWAVLLTIPPNVRYSEALVEAQRRAREAQAGLWAEGGFACTPSDHRRGKCD